MWYSYSTILSIYKSFCCVLKNFCFSETRERERKKPRTNEDRFKHSDDQTVIKYFAHRFSIFKPSTGHIRTVESGCEWALSPSIHMSYGRVLIDQGNRFFFFLSLSLSLHCGDKKIAWELYRLLKCSLNLPWIVLLFTTGPSASDEWLQVPLLVYDICKSFFLHPCSSGPWYENAL